MAMVLVFGLLLLIVVAFVTGRLRMDIGAVLLLLILTVSGILTPGEALAGFSDPVVLMSAGLFVVSDGLFQTGVAHAIGHVLGRATRQTEESLIFVAMVAGAFLSAFMSSSGTTAVLIPAIFNMASTAKISPSKVLMPLAFGSLIGGLLTLIGTPPNLVVSNELAAHGLRAFGFFSFTPVGLLTLVVGVGAMLLWGRRLLPAHPREAVTAYADPEGLLSVDELAQEYHLPDNLFRLRIHASSPLVGMTVAGAQFGAHYHVSILEVQPWPDIQKPPEAAYPAGPETVLGTDQILHVQGSPENVSTLARETGLGILPQVEQPGLLSEEAGMVELLLPPRSQLIGQTLQEVRFRDKYNVTVLSVRRLGEPLLGNVAAMKLRFGDTLLVLGSWKRIRLLQEEHRNFIVVGMPREMLDVQRSTRRMLVAGGIMLVMLGLMAFDVFPPVVAVLLAAVAMVLTECLTMEQAYAAMNWQSVILLAGMLSMTAALQKTGGMQFMAASLTATLGAYGPLAVLFGLFILTALLSQFISNTATAVLMAPVAYQASLTLGVAPHAFLMAIAVAASTAFATPMATLSSTMVMAPGGYRFGDYVKVGVLLQVLVMGVVLLVLPLLFPF
ncbi:MAG: SLC13 family permease [Anaerolineae bacterium]|nr:SLC13 family permease [Anaerolineae bacterium]